MKLTFSSLSLIAVTLTALLGASAALANTQTVRIFAMDSEARDASIGCEGDASCITWQVYKMKIVNGPEKGKIIYVAERSAKNKPRWKFKNKEIDIVEIEDEALAADLGAEYLISQ